MGGQGGPHPTLFSVTHRSYSRSARHGLSWIQTVADSSGSPGHSE
ncbi:hypothetical protein TevJSym_ae01140 [endosymbiont of Tevnia jerichonana (vent Tica)]|uniref:Uncharacterized protein n=1 Tax=endosymbiont of Tevnia jerichonana (vent Tica) TaxID=1049564 RepID=G2FDH1_9GAMM|nr:hypothetical protein TevJSym_ae01140 [endosymbiont of Tevnia jerichonana (vent Tica)]